MQTKDELYRHENINLTHNILQYTAVPSVWHMLMKPNARNIDVNELVLHSNCYRLYEVCVCVCVCAGGSWLTCANQGVVRDINERTLVGNSRVGGQDKASQLLCLQVPHELACARFRSIIPTVGTHCSRGYCVVVQPKIVRLRVANSNWSRRRCVFCVSVQFAWCMCVLILRYKSLSFLVLLLIPLAGHTWCRIFLRPYSAFKYCTCANPSWSVEWCLFRVSVQSAYYKSVYSLVVLLLSLERVLLAGVLLFLYSRSTYTSDTRSNGSLEHDSLRICWFSREVN